MDSCDSDSLGKARTYLESEHLNETIIFTPLEIDGERMEYHISIMGKNAIFTNIMDKDEKGIRSMQEKKHGEALLQDNQDKEGCISIIPMYCTEDKSAYVLLP